MRPQPIARPAKKTVNDSQLETLLRRAERFQKRRRRWWLNLADTALAATPIAHVTTTARKT